MAPEMVIMPKQPRSVRVGYSNVREQRGEIQDKLWPGIRRQQDMCNCCHLCVLCVLRVRWEVGFEKKKVVSPDNCFSEVAPSRP